MNSRSILNLNLIKYEERDIYLNQEYREQLKLRCKSIKVPALFVDGHLLGVSMTTIIIAVDNNVDTNLEDDDNDNFRESKSLSS